MAEFTVSFDGFGPVQVPGGTLLTEAAVRAGVQIAQPCGGQGRCGRCAVQVQNGGVRRRSTLRLSAADVAAGYALACQAVVEGDAQVMVPTQETLDRTLTTDRTAAEVAVPAGYDPQRDQSIQRIYLTLPPPSLDDQRDDWSRLLTAVRTQTGLENLQISLPLLRQIGSVLRAGEWRVTAVLNTDNGLRNTATLLTLLPGHTETPLLGLAIDIGTTTVSVWLVDLFSGEVLAQAAEYNRQIRCGEDVISRVIFASKNNGQAELRQLVLQSINTLIERVVQKGARKGDGEIERLGDLVSEPLNLPISQSQILKATIVGNSIMMHLLLGIPAESIRLSPFVTAVNHPPTLTAAEVGLDMHPAATVLCLPGVASYVGADITAGVLSSGLDDALPVSLFMDIGTNGEIVLGGRDWVVTCACSAGPAFEGAGVQDGMRATRGAIEEVWIDGRTAEPTWRVIGNEKPRGLCGSGLISLLAEMFLTGVVDKGGHLNQHLGTNRVRQGENGPEYVVAWANETWHGRDITITHVDIDNLIRAKAAVYAGISVLADSVGVPLETVEQVLIGGSFGKYINVEKGVQIGLLPDAPWENFKFLGNTAVLGAYYALLSQTAQQRISDIAARMTYIELSADNSFYEAFTSALFLPHTEMERFPSVTQGVEVVDGETSDFLKKSDV
ncbi:MAG TPA: ASKHA domain-containing protein [Chloroflexota bacterium]|nr:ASKHA domain-containing protein [Chloroflexota bacterium]